MPKILLNLTIVPVGPRDDFKIADTQRWRFALQVAPGFDVDLDSNHPQYDDYLKAMLPWQALHDQADSLEICWSLFPNTSPGITDGNLRASAADELSFLSASGVAFDLRSAVQSHRWKDFIPTPMTKRSFIIPMTSDPEPITADTIVLPAVWQASGTSLPALASGLLRCEWYFELELSAGLVQAIQANPDSFKIAAWPREFNDVSESLTFDHVEQPAGQDAVQVFYTIPSTAGVELRAQVRPFSLEQLMHTKEEALADYWLPTADSRLDSLLEVEQAVRDALSDTVRIHLLTAKMLVDTEATPTASNDPLADARRFLEAARSVLTGDPKSVDRASVRRVIAKAMKDANGNATSLLGKLRDTLTTQTVDEWWPSVIQSVDPNGGWRRHRASEIFEPLMLEIFPDKQPNGPVLPGEGIDVLLGLEKSRLRHEDPEAGDDTSSNSDHAQIAEFGVLVRRAREAADLVRYDWSLATACVAVADEGSSLRSRYWGEEINPGNGHTDEILPYDRRPIVRGVASAFINGIARTDITYYGAPLVAATIGSALHDYDGEEEGSTSPPDLLPIRYEPVGPVRDHVQNAARCLVPPLRYGDWYQFAGFVIDRAGGIPDEVAAADHQRGPIFDWDKLQAGQLPGLDQPAVYQPLQFLRRVPVGEINVVPDRKTSPAGLAPEKQDRPPEWPALSPDISLRSREWLSARIPDSESVPAVLLSMGRSFNRELDATSFTASAPQLDEHTLQRWLMPRATLPGEDPAQAKLQLEALNVVLADIHKKRSAMPLTPDWTKAAEAILPFDPAVSAIGLRRVVVDESGVTTESAETVGLTVTISTQIVGANQFPPGPFDLRPGTFVLLELLPLITLDDFARFEPLAMQNLIEEEPWKDATGNEYRAFHATRVLIEAASDSLPDPAEVYEALQLSALSGGAVEVSLSWANSVLPSKLAFVDGFELARQRWVWRNRPLHDPAPPPDWKTGRPAPPNWQSELPTALGDATARDTHTSVLRFDGLATLDRGLVDRGRIAGRVPRAADGSPLAAPRLLVDDRDGVSHADYLRFGCKLLSRYRGILKREKQGVEAVAVHADADQGRLEPQRRWRRIVMPFRGDKTLLKAPKILAILPLTQSIDAERPAGVSEEATPFLILLDEVWFREYGAGERLKVEIVLETKEIGDNTDTERPFRVGPLPDHYLANYMNGKYLYDPSTDDKQNIDANRKTFMVTGPFGYSLDRSGNEALANATAFIAFPPKEVRPHYAAFIRLRRELRDLSGDVREGPPGGTYALYTQPDAVQLVERSDAKLQISGDQFSGLKLDLRPMRDPDQSVMKQYRYLLIAGQTMRDVGRGSDLIIPTKAAWVGRNDNSFEPVEDFPTGEYSGRVLELLLNGRHEIGMSPIEKETSLKEILDAMFKSGVLPEDADAMIRRISNTFAISVA